MTDKAGRLKSSPPPDDYDLSAAATARRISRIDDDEILDAMDIIKTPIYANIKDDLWDTLQKDIRRKAWETILGDGRNPRAPPEAFPMEIGDALIRKLRLPAGSPGFEAQMLEAQIEQYEKNKCPFCRSHCSDPPLT